MNTPVIEIRSLTRDYGRGRGVFGLDLTVEQGEVFAFLGPNGAGKTTTIRHLMGFVKPREGSVRLFGQDCFAHAGELHRRVGYLPGELALPEELTGAGMIAFLAGLRGWKDVRDADALARRLELDPRQPIRRMSKGTKQTEGLVCALMGEPEQLILDEPTSGVDPLLQQRCGDLIGEARARGATVLLSSHLFEEVERTCSRAAVLRAGRLAAVQPMEQLRRSKSRRYIFTFADPQTAAAAAARWPQARAEGMRMTARVQGSESLPALLALAVEYKARDLETHGLTLEESFYQYYEKEARI